MNTIAKCAFGIDIDCQRNEDIEIVKNGKQVFAAFRVKNWVETFFLHLFFYFPGIEKFINLFPPAADKVREISLEIIKQREAQNIESSDFLGRLKDLITAKKTGSKDEDLEVLTTDMIAAQPIVFFTAGFETTANALCTTAYNLATNPAVRPTLIF